MTERPFRKRKRQTEIENKKRQLEDDRRQLQHLKSKALRERWLLDGVPSGGPEEDAAKKQLQEDEAKTRALEETINRALDTTVHIVLLHELWLTPTFHSTQDQQSWGAVAADINLRRQRALLGAGHSIGLIKFLLPLSWQYAAGGWRATETGTETGTAENEQRQPVIEVKVQHKVHHSPRLVKSGDGSEMMRAAMYSVEITVERDRVTGETKVLSSNTVLPKDLLHGVKVYEDAQKVVHEVREVDGVVVANGVHQLSSSEVEELILKADEVVLSPKADASPTPTPTPTPTPIPTPGVEVEAGGSPMMEIRGMETMRDGGGPEVVAVGNVSAENPVTMVFMGYQSVEDEAETNKVLGLEGAVKAELVVIEDGENKAAAGATTSGTASAEAEQSKETAPEQAPPNGSTAEPIKTPEEREGADKGGAEATGAELNNKEKQPCKCCVIM
ncbi:paralemmin 1a [Alosa sapidissima]|uniref:paralemmin 1a n=1 Tax=Alosa sapidissima TaxID=34773 RepID=UPI001C09392D|nr:paralemmin 1a [Alosa sapidissima]